MGRREANKQKKRSDLLSAGQTAFLEQGYHGTSVEQIAASAGVARGTFYLYFDGKEALFESVVDGFFVPLMQVFDQVEAALATALSPAECLAVYQQMGVSIAVVGLSQKDTVLLIFREMRSPNVPALRARELRLVQRITALTQLAMDRRLVRQGDPRLSSLIILGGIERLYFEVLAGDMDFADPRDVASEASVLLSRVLGLDLDALSTAQDRTRD
ncbi:MAG: TetR/AcrR family transcriptional regulator [Myxococcota bacterium]